MQAPNRHLARVVVLASGTGSNLQAILDACANRDLAAEVVAVVSDKDNAYALKRAAESKEARRRFETRRRSDDPVGSG